MTKAAAPSSRQGRAEYQRRIHRVVDHIDRHLDQPLELEALAAVANFSAFHFHRVFRAATGETLGDYVRRRRVEFGAVRLATQPATTVLEVALAVGFGSGEAFARAFKLRFGASPSAWRELRNSGQVERSSGWAAKAVGFDDGGPVTPPIETLPMNPVTVIDMPATPIAYHRHTGPYGDDVARFWMERVAPWMAENGLLGRVRYGIAHDDPTVTDPAQCRYDAAVTSAAGEVLSGQPMRTVLPGGRYACMPFEGTIADIDAAWQRLLGGWLPSSGLQVDARPLLEHYPVDSTFDAATGVFDCRLCVPVRPL